MHFLVMNLGHKIHSYPFGLRFGKRSEPDDGLNGQMTAKMASFAILAGSGSMLSWGISLKI